MQRNFLRSFGFFSLCFLVLSTTPAFAHHMMGGKLPSTFTEGVLSGVGHPVIGLDHLAFLIAVGIAVGIGGLSLLLPLVFVAASAVGVALHVAGIQVPAAELAVASSVVIVGALIARGSALATPVWGAVFALAGLFHGYAYGESIYGAEPAPLAAYLVGLVIIQSALATGVAYLWRRYEENPTAVPARIAGAIVAGVGITVLAQQLIPAA